MIEDLSKISPEAMQELLFVELLQQLVERSGLDRIQSHPSSPYFLEGHQAPARHHTIASRLLASKNSVRLQPKSNEELRQCLHKLYQQAKRIAANKTPGVSDSIHQAAVNLVTSEMDSINA